MPIFRVLNAPLAAHPRSRRIYSVDGLRGYLALAVVFHHVAILHLFLQKGTLQPETWGPPPSRFYALIGPAGVSMFFMITGYLFWFRVMKEKGKLNWYTLYVGRIFRIGPLYLSTVGFALVLDHLKTFNYMARISGSSTSFLKQLSSVILLGLSVYPDANRLLAGVTWSIQYEWFFYASLPLLAFLPSVPRFQMSLLVTALIGCLWVRVFYYDVSPGTRTIPIMIALFLIGMICALLQESSVKISIPDWQMSLLALAFLASVFAFRDIYTPGPLLLLGGAFCLIVSGCTVFGLLTFRPALRLGDISYGIYLLQGLILSACFRPSAFRVFALASPWGHWLVTELALLFLISLATVTYVAIERPGIEVGRRVAKMFEIKPQGPASKGCPG